MPKAEIPEAARFDDSEVVGWLNDQEWTLVPGHKYEGIDEHMYIAQAWFDGEDQELFNRALQLLNESSFTESYNGNEYQYLYDEDFKYWISESHYSPGCMLNRKEINPDNVQVTLENEWGDGNT